MGLPSVAVAPLTRAQRDACTLAETARTPREFEAAHRAMVRAFPELAAACPCECASCVRGRAREARP